MIYKYVEPTKKDGQQVYSHQAMCAHILLRE